ncbi:hypothetical protein SISSUDRAFT_1038715, partial [Sistotremastrum suecicum HHB10207 ss-3]
MAFSQTPTGNTACGGVAMAWYTSSVRETPCQTYERLRQTCNSSYTVGTQIVHGSTLTGAPDACTDQNSACCCNYIAFALSMLCLNCQRNVGSLLNGDTGYIAETPFKCQCVCGRYGSRMSEFRRSRTFSPDSTPQLNTSFPQDVQQKVCLEGLNIDDNLYSATNFSPDGSWWSMALQKYCYAKHAAIHGFSKLHVPKMCRAQYQGYGHGFFAVYQCRITAKSS